MIPKPRSDFDDAILLPETNTHWGTWGAIEWCPEGTFAMGFMGYGCYCMHYNKQLISS